VTKKTLKRNIFQWLLGRPATGPIEVLNIKHENGELLILL